MPKIEVTFVLDEHGSLDVQASESLNGQTQSLTVQHHFDMPSKHWNQQRIASILRDAEEHRQEDEQWNARIAAKSRFEQYIFGLRTSLEHDAWSVLLSESEQNTIARVHEESIAWLRDHEAATSQQYDEQLRQIQAISQPIVQRM